MISCLRRRVPDVAVLTAIVLTGCVSETLPPAPLARASLADGVTRAESLAILQQIGERGASAAASVTTVMCTIDAWNPGAVMGCSEPVPTVVPEVPWLQHVGQARDPGEIEQRAPISISFAGDHKGTLEGERVMTNRRIVFWTLAVVGVALPAGASAQRDTIVAAACAEALSALQRGIQGDAYRRTVLSFYSCPDAGARALAAEWTHPPGDSLARRTLVAVSWNIQDRRIYDAVTQVVRNGGASRDLRLDAIEVLVGYFDPCLGIRFQTPEPGILAPPVALGERYHGSAKPGAQPLLVSVRADVLNTLRQVGATDRDEVVGKIATYLAERLAEMHDPLHCTGGMLKPRE